MKFLVLLILCSYFFFPVVHSFAESHCCEKLVVRSSQNGVGHSYKGKSFHIFASDAQSSDAKFRDYSSSLIRIISEQFGAYYSPSPGNVALRVYVHYDSIALPFFVDQLDKAGLYMRKSCLYSPDARLARHRFFVDVVDSKTGKTVLEARSTAESAMCFHSVAPCMIDASVYDVRHNYRNRASMCDSCSY